MNTYDVVIVGAGTAGTYFAYLLAKKGVNVLVIDQDAEDKIAQRLDIFHFTTESFATYHLPPSQAGDPEFVRQFSYCYSRSALNQHEKKNFLEVSVMHLPLFIKRLRDLARSAGAKFSFSTAFSSLIYDGENRIAGIKTKDSDIIKSRLVVDASGIPAVVRRQIEDPYMENFPIGPRDKFYVLLKYVKLEDGNNPVHASTSWPYYKGWIAPQHTEGGAIIGVGANLSEAYARKCMATFESNIPLPAYTLQYEEWGTTPYRRPPYSFVTDGFLVLGDAACLTKPMNGEGITSAWVQATPAAGIVAEALREGQYPTKKALWEINHLYQTGEGAEFAGIRALLVGAVAMSKKDNDYLFKHGIIFRSDDEVEVIDVPKCLIKGVFKGEFSLKALLSLLKASSIAAKLTAHYRRYPHTPDGYRRWQKKADRLWKKAGSMADNIKDWQE
ncbi:MAG: NAD(P)/FAD-dependent oxidoreductase [Bacilli bacterium]|jgi:digeranylgeranylglycerophospholipid reductase